jgi:predicted RecB family nuclease
MLATYPVGQVPGISKTHAESLAYVGIANTGALLARCKTPEGRKSLADMMAVSKRKLDAWVEAAKLLQLPGLGPRQAKRLSAAGIRSLAELAKTKRKLKGLDKPDKKGLVIAPDKLASWVTAAQAAAPG